MLQYTNRGSALRFGLCLPINCLSSNRALDQFPSDNFPPTFRMHLCCHLMEQNLKPKSFLTWTRMFSLSEVCQMKSLHFPPKTLAKMVKESNQLNGCETMSNSILTGCFKVCHHTYHWKTYIRNNYGTAAQSLGLSSR